jgi:hypothetical protein
VMAAGPLLDFYTGLTEALLGLAGVPIVEGHGVVIVGGLPAAALPVVEMPTTVAFGDAPFMLWAATVAALAMGCRRGGLLRHFLLFCLLLAIAGGGAAVAGQWSRMEPAAMMILWMRGEFLVWLALPWMAGALFVIFQPRSFSGVVWMAALQLYAVGFSSLRLAFCLGVLHYAGPALFPLLWFVFGLLAAVVGLLVAYSMSLSQVGRGLWGGRKTWGA